MGKLAMIAFGGNALLRAGQKGSFAEQMENVELTCSQLIPLVEQGCDLVIGHGNGPQVGNAQLRHKACKDTYGLEAMPLDFCVAETQGSIAYMIETAMEYALNKAGLDKRVASIVTRVEVSADDPAFDNPSKPVGPYFTAAEAAAMPWVNWKEDPQGRGFRKVVPSPEPLRINNIDLVEDLARHGCIVVTCGGVGIPVLNDGRGHHGVEAVIDKDLASALAAVQMRGDDFYILTDISKVYINFRKPDQKQLDVITVSEAERYLANGEFAEGSMAPKVRAGVFFVKNGGSQCVITEAGQLGNPACGTRIIP